MPEHVDLAETGLPMFITIAGREIVVMDAVAFRTMQDAALSARPAVPTFIIGEEHSEALHKALIASQGKFTGPIILADDIPRPDSDMVERIVEAVIDAANIVSHDGYYEIDQEAATLAAIAAITGEGA